MGAALADRPRDAFVLSTKVGRLVVPTASLTGDEDVDRQAAHGREDAFYADTVGRRVVFDYSADGVRRSIAASLERLGLERIDIAYIHDPDDHWQAAIGGAYPALDRLREEGLLGAIGAGMNQSAMLTRFVREADIDVILLAGRYTLLDQDAIAVLLPACVERGVAVMVGGVMNSGILADPRPGAAFNYAEAPPEVVKRAQALSDACMRHDVPVKAAAMQFPLAHPAVAGLIAGVRTIPHLDEYADLLGLPIPGALWDDLRSTGLLPADAPVPAAA
jgi:D-threo-aldose 1-dehydrogenase